MDAIEIVRVDDELIENAMGVNTPEQDTENDDTEQSNRSHEGSREPRARKC